MRIRENFGLREAFGGYPLIEVLIKAIRCRLSKVPLFLSSTYRQGRHINCLVTFRVFDQTKLKNKQTELLLFFISFRPSSVTPYHDHYWVVVLQPKTAAIGKLGSVPLLY